jgi:hypothetical protein
MTNLNTSRAQTVVVDIFNLDNIPLSAVYTSGGVAVDLTGYKFVFQLLEKDVKKKEYTLDAGVLATAFLSKTGADVNVLNMEAMFQDIQGLVIPSMDLYRLLMVVTDPDNKTYVHIIYKINARRY